MGRFVSPFTYTLFLAAIFSTRLIAGQAASPAGTGPATTSAGTSQTSTPQVAGQADTSSTATVLKIKTRLVVVDVVALDHRGAAVKDLKAEDFTLQEDGQEQKVRVFNFQQPAQGAAQAALTPVALPPGRATNMPLFKTSSTLNVLLLDGINVTSANQKYARQEMLKLLEKLPAGQPLAVFALGSKLRMLQDFTTDPALLKDALRKAKDNALAIRTPVSAAADLPPGMLESMPEAMVQQVLRVGQDLITNQMQERVVLTLNEMSALARTLSGYPGRKNLIWVSEAFPSYLFPVGDTSSPQNTNPINAAQQSVITSFQAQVDHTADLLSNAQVAVYPVDAGTLANKDSYSTLSNTDTNGNYLGRSARGGTLPGVGSLQANELGRASEATINSHGTMNSIAEQTGGKAFYNTNNIEKAIHESMEDGALYYTLGYYPDNKNWDGRFRKITVKVNRPGIKVHYRQGFFAVEPGNYAKKDPKLFAIEMGTALSIENPISTALTFQASVAPPSEQTGNKVLIRYGIDPHAISFELKANGNTFSAALTADQYQKVIRTIYPCNQSLELPPGDYFLRLAVRDDSSGLIGTANAQVSIPAATTAEKSAQQEQKKP